MQIDATVFSTVVAVVALVIAIYVLWKARARGAEITSGLVTSTLEEATTSARELAEVALTAAQAAEQLYRKGEIERSERLDHAFSYVRQWFPGLDKETIITALEAAVLTVNSVVALLPTKSN